MNAKVFAGSILAFVYNRIVGRMPLKILRLGYSFSRVFVSAVAILRLAHDPRSTEFAEH